MGCATAETDPAERSPVFDRLGPGEWPGPQHVVCAEGECDLSTGEGCDENTTCAPTSLDYTEATAACLPGISERLFCCTPGSREECGPGRICADPVGDLAPFPAIGCRPLDDCDPISATGCELGEACVFVRAYGGFTYCAPAGTLGVDSPCESLLDCRPGLVCLNNITTLEVRCKKYCDMRSNRGCATGQTCEPFLEEKLDYGWCD